MGAARAKSPGRGRGRSGAGRSERVPSQAASPSRSRACPRMPARPKMYPSRPRGGSAFAAADNTSPLTGSNRRPLLTMETSQATGCSRWQRIWLVSAVSACRRFAVDCRRLQPRGSVKAPSGRSPRDAVHRWSSGHHWICDADLTSLRSTPRARCRSRTVGRREGLALRLSTRLLGFPNSRSTTWLSFTPVITRGDA
jgi:hypothetical protein